MNSIQFTRSEVEILSHRLGASDAVSEVLEDEWPDRDATERACRELDEALQTGKPVEVDALRRAILIDCCTGSTYFGTMGAAVAEGDFSRQKWRAMMGVAVTLEEKLSREFACDVAVATW